MTFNIPLDGDTVKLLDEIIAMENGAAPEIAKHGVIDIEVLRALQSRRQLEWNRQSFVHYLVQEYANAVYGIEFDQPDVDGGEPVRLQDAGQEMIYAVLSDELVNRLGEWNAANHMKNSETVAKALETLFDAEGDDTETPGEQMPFRDTF